MIGTLLHLCRFFGGFSGFGGQQEEESTPKGNDVVVDLEVSLQDLYLGNHFEVRLLPGPCPEPNEQERTNGCWSANPREYPMKAICYQSHYFYFL